MAIIIMQLWLTVNNPNSLVLILFYISFLDKTYIVVLIMWSAGEIFNNGH